MAKVSSTKAASIPNGRNISVVSFNKSASIVIKALKAQEGAVIKSGKVIESTFLQYLDSCTMAGIPRDQAGVNAIGKEILECPVMAEAIAIYGPVFRNTVSSYSGGAKRAYYWGLDWYASAHLSPEKGGMAYLPWGKGAKAEAAKKGARAGTVTKTNNEALLATLRKAIEQSMILNRLEMKGALIDLACEIDPEFKV